MIVEYELGSTYTDKGRSGHPDDQFLRWVNIEGSGMLNSPGIRPLRNVNRMIPNGLPAYLILVTHEKSSSNQLNPWDDIVDLSNAEIFYWGDSKAHPIKRLDDFAGNSVLRRAYDYILEGGRDAVPPILHFSKPSAGHVRFNGLCVMSSLEIAWFFDNGRPVRNYRARLTVLDCDRVTVAWLHHRALASSIEELDRHADCPDAWKRYRKGQTVPIDIWQAEIRSRSDQLPKANSDDEQLLEQLASLKPFDFERVVVAAFEEIKDVTHHVEGTRPTGDGGFDFFGRFVLQRPLGYVIHFRGEVKRYARSTAVSPKDVSRLVARLGRKEYGIFVTTSYFTEQAQKEVLSDAYPIHLIAGIDLVKMLRYQQIADRTEIRRSWLESVLTIASSCEVSKGRGSSTSGQTVTSGNLD